MLPRAKSVFGPACETIIIVVVRAEHSKLQDWRLITAESADHGLIGRLPLSWRGSRLEGRGILVHVSASEQS